MTETRGDSVFAVMRLKPLHLAIASGLALVLLTLIERPASIPPDFQFQSHFSRHQAQVFCANARHEMRHIYWQTIYKNLRTRQFKYAWDRLKNGPGRVAGVVTNANSDVVAYIQSKAGDGFWITLESGQARALAKRP